MPTNVPVIVDAFGGVIPPGVHSEFGYYPQEFFPYRWTELPEGRTLPGSWPTWCSITPGRTVFGSGPLEPREGRVFIPLPNVRGWLPLQNVVRCDSPCIADILPHGYVALEHDEALRPGDLVVYVDSYGETSVRLVRIALAHNHYPSNTSRYRMPGPGYTTEQIDAWFAVCQNGASAGRALLTASARKPISFRSTNSRPLPLP